MSSIGTGYDLSASTFSPDGRIFQVEYAGKAIDATGTAIGLRGKNGVVFAVEKLISTKLYEPTTNQRITNIDDHVGFASAGLYPDARAIAAQCRDEAQDYALQYRSKVPLKHLAERCAMYMHAYTLYSAIRPFGCAIMLSSWAASTGPQLYMVDPAGLCYGFHGCAIGKAKQAAKTEIEKLKNLANMSVEELVKEAARIIYATREETKEKSFRLELSWVGENTKGVHQLVPADVALAAEAFAKRSLEESDSEGEEPMVE